MTVILYPYGVVTVTRLDLSTMLKILSALLIVLAASPALAANSKGSQESALEYSVYLLSGGPPFASSKEAARQAIKSISRANDPWCTDEAGPAWDVKVSMAPSGPKGSIFLSRKDGHIMCSDLPTMDDIGEGN